MPVISFNQAFTNPVYGYDGARKIHMALREYENSCTVSIFLYKNNCNLPMCSSFSALYLDASSSR